MNEEKSLGKHILSCLYQLIEGVGSGGDLGFHGYG